MSHPAFARTDHRSWPHPAGRWTWTQTWRDLLFAHWPVPSASLRARIPAELEIDESEGSAWIGVVPFRMHVRPRGLPRLPGLSFFSELNLRTYVRRDGVPGVWFFSLDASNPVIVWAARRFFHLPYFRARMRFARSGDEIAYASERIGAPEPVRFAARYAPAGAQYTSREGSLEHWLTERYCLYTRTPAGACVRGDIHHLPWPLRPARAEIDAAEMLAAAGLAMPSGAPLLHFAERLDVALWPLAPVRERGVAP